MDISPGPFWVFAVTTITAYGSWTECYLLAAGGHFYGHV